MHGCYDFLLTILQKMLPAQILTSTCSYQHLNFKVSIRETSSASIQISSFNEIPVMMISVSSSFESKAP